MNRFAPVLLACWLGLPGGALASGTAAPAANAVRMQAVSFAGWDAVMTGQRGYVTVVDFWATWCAPCIERFPHMVEMDRAYRDRGVRFIALNLDERGDDESIAWAEAFLERIGAEFPNYHLDENMTAAFERLDLLGLPAVRVYDPDGTETHRLSGDNPLRQFTEKDVENAILELLAR